MRRRLTSLLVWDLPELVSPLSLIGAMVAIAAATIFDRDGFILGAGLGLLMSAATHYMANDLRKRR